MRLRPSGEQLSPVSLEDAFPSAIYIFDGRFCRNDTVTKLFNKCRTGRRKAQGG